MTATLNVSGIETQRADQSWDIGPFEVSFSVMNYQFTESVYYGQYSTPASVAAQIAGSFTRDYYQNGLVAFVSGSTVTFKLKATGATFGMLTVTGPTSSFQLYGSGFGAYNWTPTGVSGAINNTYTMTGGQDAGTYYDSGTVSVRVSGAVASVDWTEGSTVSSLASELSSAIDTAAGSFVNASASGATVSVASLGGGAAADMTIMGTATDTNPTYFCMQTPPYTCSPSFSVATTNMTGGVSTEGALLYGFTIADYGGYDLNGNVLSAWDLGVRPVELCL